MFFQKFTNILYYSEKYALAQKRKVKMQIQGCVTIVLEIDTLSFLKCTLILFLPRYFIIYNVDKYKNKLQKVHER